MLAMEQPAADGQIFNIGSGRARTLLDIARVVVRQFGTREPLINGMFRSGDIRHCTADLTRSATLLGYAPQISFAEGIQEYLSSIDASTTIISPALDEQELRRHGLSADA